MSMSMWGIAAGAFSVSILRGVSVKFRAWKVYRNSLPDEQREMLFWNDRNYERLEDLIHNAFWIYALVLAIPMVIWFVGNALGWW